MLHASQISKNTDILQRVESEVGQTIGLGQLEPDTENGIVNAVVRGTSSFSFNMALNHRYPIHASAPGKAMMAYMPVEEREAYYSVMSFEQFTQNTIRSREDFEAELISVREKGYGLDVSEELEGCHCIGVPVFVVGHGVVASLWTTGPSGQLPVRNFEQIADVLKKGAQEVAQRLSNATRAPNRDYIHHVVEEGKLVIESNLHRIVDVSELAENLYVGYSWFRKIFKEQVGMAPAAYHQHCRIERAKRLLAETKQTVREISDALGFKNQNHFSAYFKRKVGDSPVRYRAKQSSVE